MFVLPGGEAFGRGAADTILQAEHQARTRHTVLRAPLQAGNGSCCAGGGQRPAGAVLRRGVAGPLLDVLANRPAGCTWLATRGRQNDTGGGGRERLGRPTADAQMRAWRGTAKGLEGVAAETSDALLILDEMGQADAREVADVIYMLANESGKQRASRTGTARRRQSWRTLFLSTGEISLPLKMGEAGKRPAAGLGVRLVNLPADAGAGLGVFQNLHGRANADSLADELRASARAHHGIAARAFLACLAQDRAANAVELRETLAALKSAFVADFVPEGATGQVLSVAGRSH